MSRKLFSFIIVISLFFSFSNVAFAAKVPRCTDAKPTTAPTIVKATPGNNSVTLVWTEGEMPITHYLLEYGLAKDSFIYGAQNIGPKGTTTYTVNNLNNGTRYYFRVNAVNNCRLKPSHSVSAVAGLGSISYIGSYIPKLSFYKEASAISNQVKTEQKGAAVPTDTAKNKVAVCANGCYGWQLLTVEIIALLAFFFFAYRYTSVKPIFAPIIPVLTALSFYLLNNKCTSQAFFCQYFYILNIALFILIMAFQRQRLMHKALGDTKI